MIAEQVTEHDRRSAVCALTAKAAGLIADARLGDVFRCEAHFVSAVTKACRIRKIEVETVHQGANTYRFRQLGQRERGQFTRYARRRVERTVNRLPGRTGVANAAQRQVCGPVDDDWCWRRRRYRRATHGRRGRDLGNDRRGTEWQFLQPSWIADLPDGVITFLVVHKGQDVRFPCPGDRGRILRNRRNGAGHVGQLILLLRIEIVEEEVRDPGTIRDVDD